MQIDSSILADLLKTFAGTLIGLIPYFVTTYRNRKKSAIDEAEALARTKLAEANTRSVEMRDVMAASESMNKMLTSLLESGDTIHELQKKVFDLEQDKLGDDMLRLDLKKATALLAYNNVRFYEAEHPDVRKMIEALDRMMGQPKK